MEQIITSETNASLTAEVKVKVARLRGENVELKRESGTLDSTKRRVESLEGKVSTHDGLHLRVRTTWKWDEVLTIDGRINCRKVLAKGE